jgi:flagellin-specific chaperone FliS
VCSSDLEKAKEIDEATYTRIVDDLSAKYQKIKGMTVDEVSEITKELKSNWKKIKDEAKKTQLLSAGQSKPAAKKAVAKKPATKTTSTK